MIYQVLLVAWLLLMTLSSSQKDAPRRKEQMDRLADRSQKDAPRRKEQMDRLADQVTDRTKDMKNAMEDTNRRNSAPYEVIAANPRSFQEPNIMFWRPQKVGSSTVESILVSYAYRHYLVPRLRTLGIRNSNLLCSMIALCGLAKVDTIKAYAAHSEELKDIIYMMMSTNSIKDKSTRNIDRNKAIFQKFEAKDTIVKYQYKLSVNHQLCNLPYHIIKNEINCAFSSNITDTIHRNKKESFFNIKQVFAVREPLSRAVSVYYYWGECYKVGKLMDDKTALRNARGKQIGSFNTTEPIKGPHLVYHGQETTVPPTDIAITYAKNLPFTAGMPGPSYTWSAFSNSYKDAVEQIYKDDIMSVVLERLDESLVVLSHYFGWSLAEVTEAISKKISSPHPKYSSWPPEAVSIMKQELVNKGEFAVYEASNKKLDGRIKSLKSDGFDVEGEVELLRLLKQEVSATCGNLTYLAHYRKVLNRDKLRRKGVVNKLREVDDVYFEEGHVFSYGNEILYSFDICNSCEAHAILYSNNNNNIQGYMKLSSATTSDKNTINHKANLLALIEADEKVKTLPQFSKCT